MNILLVAPYPNLVKTAQRTLMASPYSVEVLLGDLQQGLQAAETKINRNEADIIVSRGGTASLLRQNLSIPVFEIDVTGYDLLRAIYPHTQRHRKIAVIGYENVISGARSIAETLHINLGYFQVNPQQHIEAVIREARTWGAHIIIGDTISVHTARELGLESELVQSGPEAVLSAVESAANFIGHMQTEIVRNKRLNMIMEHADRGVIYIAADNCVEMLNTKAEHILQRNREQLIGRPLTLDTAPAELVKAVAKRVSHQLISFDDKDYMLEVLEINTEGRHAATLVFLQSSGRIRDLEGMLRREMTSRGLIATYFFSQLTAENSMFKKTIDKARRYSHTNSTILLLGETGSGKEVFAQSIHNDSLRKDGPFVAVNCAALPDSLLESELFGYAEGAFTGARKGGKPGLFEMAHKGTIFLDEVNDMSNTVQARFLRVLQEKQVMRVGDNRLYDVDVRVIAACNKNLFAETEAGTFRKDLYYRLRVLDIEIPPLREREEDILPLFNSFINYFNEKYSYRPNELPPGLIKAIVSARWPGNVRQLRNFAEKVSVLFSLHQDREEIEDDLIKELSQEVHHTQDNIQTLPQKDTHSLKAIKSSIVRESWLKNEQNISETARQLGIDRATVRKHLNKTNAKEGTKK